MSHSKALARAPSGTGVFLWGLVFALSWASAEHARAAPGERGRRASGDAVKAALVDTSSEYGMIDWTRGMIIAHGRASADIRAPSPDVARVKAEREARTMARRALLARARMLTIGTRTVAEYESDADIATRLQAAVERSLDLSVEYASDGSVMSTAGLPLESVRVAVVGVPDVAAQPTVKPGAKPTVKPGAKPGGPGVGAVHGAVYDTIIINARGVLERPSLGLQVALPEGSFAGPTVFHGSVKAALADRRAGARVLVARAVASDDDSAQVPALRLDTAQGVTLGYERASGGKRRQPVAPAPSVSDIAPAMGGGALLVIVIGEQGDRR